MDFDNKKVDLSETSSTRNLAPVEDFKSNDNEVRSTVLYEPEGGARIGDKPQRFKRGNLRLMKTENGWKLEEVEVKVNKCLYYAKFL